MCFQGSRIDVERRFSVVRSLNLYLSRDRSKRPAEDPVVSGGLELIFFGRLEPRFRS